MVASGMNSWRARSSRACRTHERKESGFGANTIRYDRIARWATRHRDGSVTNAIVAVMAALRIIKSTRIVNNYDTPISGGPKNGGQLIQVIGIVQVSGCGATVSSSLLLVADGRVGNGMARRAHKSRAAS